MSFIDELKKVLPGDAVVTDQESLQHYGRDWTRQFTIRPSAIAFPETTEQIQKLVVFANTHKVGLVPSGGRTGLSGGACALNGEVVVSLTRMNKILDFNETDQTIRCQAGVVTEALQKHAEERGFYFPVDFAASGSSCVGGNIATNAGGVKVLRYGMMREWVVDLTVVTGKGDILHLNRGLIKNATGFDLRHLFCGSEGILGFVTEATLRLTRPSKELATVLLATPNLDSVMACFREFRKGISLTAFEFFSDQALKHVQHATGLSSPLAQASPFYVLVEAEILGEASQNALEETFGQCLEQGYCSDGAIAQNTQQATDFWRLREDISESLAKYTPYKNDISVTIGKVPDFLNEVDAALKKSYPEFEVIWFGHIGDGNVHINILKPADWKMEDFVLKCQKVSEILFSIVQKYGGAISAEHGVGLVKKQYLKFSRSDEEIALMRAIKSAFDPSGIMNPGKVL